MNLCNLFGGLKFEIDKGYILNSGQSSKAVRSSEYSSTIHVPTNAPQRVKTRRGVFLSITQVIRQAGHYRTSLNEHLEGIFTGKFRQITNKGQ